jgi:hypothetical protein
MRVTHYTWYQSRIPVDMADRWERNVIIQKGEDYLRELLADTRTLVSIGEFICKYFDWSSSIEGYDYWNDCWRQSLDNPNGRDMVSRVEIIKEPQQPIQGQKKISWKMEKFELL